MVGLKCRVENSQLLAALRERGMLAVQAGDNVVRLLPPLIVGEEEVDLACATIDAACVALKSTAPGRA
jgi:acetylornithine/N-succinyldiaminopimelate aminotransferase